MRRYALALLVAVAGTGIVSSGAHAADGNTPKQPTKHVVVSGDNLSAIATAHSLDNWRPIWNANDKLANPDVINVGDELVIPDKDQPTTDRPLPPGYGEPTTAPVAAAPSGGSVSRSKSVANFAQGAGGILARIRMRESGGNYATNTGNGYYGAYQFNLGTWRGVGGSGLPSDASPAEQDMRAQMLYDRRGCSPWPSTCY